jgi:hypothetical protein
MLLLYEFERNCTLIVQWLVSRRKCSDKNWGFTTDTTNAMLSSCLRKVSNSHDDSHGYHHYKQMSWGFQLENKNYAVSLCFSYVQHGDTVFKILQ